MPPTQVLDTSSLLRSCVQGAVGMLRDREDARPRGMQRVEILLGLLSEDDADRGAGARAVPSAQPLRSPAAAFLRVCKARLHGLLKQQEENSAFSRKDWVSREASNQDALQEAGTFRYGPRGASAGHHCHPPAPGRRVLVGL